MHTDAERKYAAKAAHVWRASREDETSLLDFYSIFIGCRCYCGRWGIEMKRSFGMMVFAAGMALLLTGCGEAKEAYEQGMSLALEGKYEQSLPYFEKAIEEKKEQTEYYIGYGMALNRLNRYEQAKEEFVKVMQETDNKISKKNNKQLYYGMAVSEYGLGEYDAVEEYCDKALSIEYLEDMDCDILYTRMVAFSQQEKWEQAKKDCQEIIQKDDEYFDAFLALARIECSMGNYDEAVKAYLDVIKKDKTNYEVYFELYGQYCRSGQKDAANELLDQLLEIKPDKAQDWMVVGRAYYLKKDYDKAKECLGTAYQGKCGESKYYLGMVYAEELLYGEAADAFQTYIKENKDALNVEVYCRLAEVYMEQKDYDNAQDAIVQGLSYGSSSAVQDLKRMQVILLEKQNKYDEALSAAKEYKKMYPSDAAMQKELSFIKTRIN